MKVVIFAWMPREKPPFFGFQPTWVYVKKYNLKNVSEEKIKKIILKLFEEVGAYDWKVVIYNNFTHYNYYYRVE